MHRFLLVTLLLPAASSALHHLKRDPVHWVSQRASGLPLKVTNSCGEDIYAAIQTTHGTGPPSSGFLLKPGDSNSQTVSDDWSGRVWPRTNCSFNSDGTASANGAGSACSTGDCGGTVNCAGSGQPPATLAEFTFADALGHTVYDISLVDGYNIPLAILSLLGISGNSSLTDIPPNLTNPICIATAALLAAQGDTSSATYGTNSTYPLPLDQAAKNNDVQDWCPWDLQQSPPQKPGDGVYPYPDDNIQRPLFNPCLSACSKYQSPQYCCTEKYNSPDACKPSLYATQAKKVCPDAYSYAFDDGSSTFTIPAGGGFEVVFCPPGRSTTILKTFGAQLQQLAQTGQVTEQIQSDTQNITLIRMSNVGSVLSVGAGYSLMAAMVALAITCL